MAEDKSPPPSFLCTKCDAHVQVDLAVHQPVVDLFVDFHSFFLGQQLALTAILQVNASKLDPEEECGIDSGTIEYVVPTKELGGMYIRRGNTRPILFNIGREEGIVRQETRSDGIYSRRRKEEDAVDATGQLACY